MLTRFTAALVAACALAGPAHASDFSTNQMAAIKLLAMADNASALCAFPITHVDTFLAQYGLTNDQLSDTQIETKIGEQMFEAEKADPNFCSQFADLLKVNPNARMLFDR
jgi:hypothetical protein